MRELKKNAGRTGPRFPYKKRHRISPTALRLSTLKQRAARNPRSSQRGNREGCSQQEHGKEAQRRTLPSEEACLRDWAGAAARGYLVLHVRKRCKLQQQRNQT